MMSPYNTLRHAPLCDKFLPSDLKLNTDLGFAWNVGAWSLSRTEQNRTGCPCAFL